MKYGINMTWNDLQKDEGALALVRMAIQNFSKNPVISTVSGLAG